MDTAAAPRPPYPSDVDDEEWAFVVPYLTLMDEAVPQRRYPLRELFNGLRWMVRAGAQWRMLPTNLPPWHAVYEQTQRWLAAGCFERLVHDLRVLIRLGEGRAPDPSGVIIDSRTMQSTPESGARVTLAYVDAAYTGPAPAQAAADAGIHLEVVSLPETKRGFVLLPRRWVV